MKKCDRDERAANRAINAIKAFGTSRHINKNDGKVKSVGTARSYRQTFKLASRFCAQHKTPLGKISKDLANQFLQHRAPQIQNTQLQNERKALEHHLQNIYSNKNINLDKISSTREPPKLVPRAYSHDQVKLIIKHSSDRQALSTAIAYQAGLRASELLTISRAIDRPVTHRTNEWSSERFTGGREQWNTYTVIGKGGLPREVKLSDELAQRLEQHRHAEPLLRTDRTIHCNQLYNINGGQTFSQQFGYASRQSLGFSNGAHGLRHAFAQQRLAELMAAGKTAEQAKPILSQELGHWSEKIIERYLR